MKQRIHLLTTGVLALGLLATSSASAGESVDYDELVDATERQQELNDQGVTAIDDGDYEQAIEVYEASLELGELNVTHTNLARAHQLAGNCQEADDHFEKALEAPPVENPTPSQLAGVIDDYRDELRSDCPGVLEVECTPSDIDLFIDDDGPQECEVGPRELMPGNYSLRGEYRDNITETTVAVEALETSRAHLALTGEFDDEPPGDTVAEIERPPEAEPAGGAWMWLAGAGAAVAGGVVLDTVPEQASNYEFNAINLVPVGLYAAGAGLGFVGIRDMMR